MLCHDSLQAVLEIQGFPLVQGLVVGSAERAGVPLPTIAAHLPRSIDAQLVAQNLGQQSALGIRQSHGLPVGIQHTGIAQLGQQGLGLGRAEGVGQFRRCVRILLRSRRCMRSNELLQAVLAEGDLPLVNVEVHGLYALYFHDGAGVVECSYLHKYF